MARGSGRGAGRQQMKGVAASERASASRRRQPPRARERGGRERAKDALLFMGSLRTGSPRDPFSTLPGWGWRRKRARCLSCSSEQVRLWVQGGGDLGGGANSAAGGRRGVPCPVGARGEREREGRAGGCCFCASLQMPKERYVMHTRPESEREKRDTKVGPAQAEHGTTGDAPGCCCCCCCCCCCERGGCAAAAACGACCACRCSACCCCACAAPTSSCRT